MPPACLPAFLRCRSPRWDPPRYTPGWWLLDRLPLARGFACGCDPAPAYHPPHPTPRPHVTHLILTPLDAFCYFVDFLTRCTPFACLPQCRLDVLPLPGFQTPTCTSYPHRGLTAASPRFPTGSDVPVTTTTCPTIDLTPPCYGPTLPTCYHHTTAGTCHFACLLHCVGLGHSHPAYLHQVSHVPLTMGTPPMPDFLPPRCPPGSILRRALPLLPRAVTYLLDATGFLHGPPTPGLYAHC